MDVSHLVDVILLHLVVFIPISYLYWFVLK